ncbi:MAG: hypothetical protein ACRELB_03895 [Polyangiaceae bacterium]
MHAAIVMLPVLVLAAPPARPRHDPVAAEALFLAGRELLKHGEWASACARLGESQLLDAAAGTALNLAVCEDKQGHVASAWQRLREALDLLPPGDDRVPLARRELAALEPRLPHLTVRLAREAPPGTRVLRDGVEIEVAVMGFAEPVDPGSHTVRVTASGHPSRVYAVDAREGVSEELVVEPGVAAPAVQAHADGRRVAGWIALGVGVPAAALGAVTGLTVIDRRNERQRLCPDDACATPGALANARSIDSSGKALSLVSTISFAVAAAGVASGVYLLVTSSDKEPRAVVGAGMAPGGGALTLAGSF